MTHGFAVGEAVEREGTQGLTCDVCGYTTYVTVEDEDATWVLCGPCQRRAAA
jgi:uncharacterized ferredoxin-like protein